MVLKDILEINFGIISSIFDNGKDAIDSYQKKLRRTCCPATYRLVLTDIMMPEVDGYQVSREIVMT